MFTVSEKRVYKQEINKSEFIGIILPLSSQDDVKNILASIKQEYPNATHYCFAYVLGDTGDNFKYYDDGEPSNTAGVVIYNVLKNKALTNVMCVVVRYFGGILLGAGGLVRAYSTSTSLALNDANIIELKHYQTICFSFDYPYTNQILRFMEKQKQIDKQYTEKVTFSYSIEDIEIESVKQRLVELTNGTIIFL